MREELNRLKQDITGKNLSIIFDGTTHVCEAFVVVLRYLDDWEIKQNVCRLMLLTKTLTGKVARLLITALSTELGIPTASVVAVMRDRALVNDVAVHNLSVVYNQMVDVGCFSHTLVQVGEHMNTPILDKFTTAWIGLFSHSPKSRLAWRMQTGLPSLSYSSTRW